MLLKDICDFKNGKNCKSLSKGSIPLIGSIGKIGCVDQILISENCCVIARVGANCGFVQYINFPCWISDNAIICTSKNVDLKYLYYLLSKTDINSLKTGGAQPLITSEILGSINIEVPNLPTQQHIVDYIKGNKYFSLISYFLFNSSIILYLAPLLIIISSIKPLFNHLGTST